MPSLQLYRNSELKIENRVIHGLDEILQAFIVMAKTSNPLREKETCIDEMVGGSTISIAETLLAARIKEITDVLKEDYDVEEIAVESVDVTDSDEITIAVVMTDPYGRTARGEFNVIP